jgi:hypothetical protein
MRSHHAKTARLQLAIDKIDVALASIHGSERVKILGIPVPVKGVEGILLDERRLLTERLEFHQKLDGVDNTNFVPSQAWDKYTDGKRGWQ